MGFDDLEWCICRNTLSLPMQDAEEILASDTGRFEIYVDRLVTDYLKLKGFDYCCDVLKRVEFSEWDDVDLDGNEPPSNIYELASLALWTRIFTVRIFRSCWASHRTRVRRPTRKKRSFL